jgi:uncharacterized protein YlxW (UPF0749 family)
VLSKVETSVRPSAIKPKPKTNQSTHMETILAFSLGMVTVISIMVAVVVVKLYKNSDRMLKDIQDHEMILRDHYQIVEKIQDELSRRIDELSGELHRRIDQEGSEFQRQLDSRLDKLEDRLAKNLLKG